MLPSMVAVLLSPRTVSTSVLATVPHATEGPEAMSYQAESFNDEVTFRDLWEGMDFVNPFMFMNGSVASESLTHDMILEAPEASVEIFGLQNTGTNLLSTMLLTIFGGRLNYFDWGYPEKTNGIFRRGLWKHANLQMKYEAEPEDFKALTANDVVALIMVRDPLSWLQSMRKAPYELDGCVTWSDYSGSWLNRTCQHPHPAGFQSTVNKTNFATLEQVWNNWTHAHMEAMKYGFEQKSGFDRSLIIRYEDLVEYPHKQMDRISAAIGVQQLEPWQVVSDPAKTHGSCLGREEALQKLKNKTYLDEYFPHQTTTACRLLDPALMSANKYMQCEQVLEEAGLSETS